MRYWVISPNVKNNAEPENDWVNAILKTERAFIGWGTDNDKGRIFSNIEIGDLILIAKREKWSPKVIMCGIANSTAIYEDLEDTPSEAQNIELIYCLKRERLEKLNLDFAGTAYYGDNSQIPAIYELHPERNPKDNQLVKALIFEIEKTKQMENLNYYVNLLKTNKNIILSGAPGTGKTYLARRIAEQITESQSTSEFSPDQLLQERIKNFMVDEDERAYLESKRNDFLNEFPLSNIKNIQLDDYCIGTGETGNFCWWMEKGLKELGLFWPAQRGAYVYGIYWNDDSKEFKIDKKFEPEKDPDKILNKIKEIIENSINDEKWLENSANLGLISNGFLLKVLYTYLPDIYFPVNGKQHIENIIKLFNIVVPPKSNIFHKNKAIMEFYRNRTKGKDITSLEFMRILYSSFNIADGEIIENKKIVIKGDFDFVQFHPSYDYTDFVEGLRPVKKDNKEIGFELRPGIFKSLCLKAVKNPNKNYAIVIDEINRSEISKVFGELFFSIDPGYRGLNGQVKTQYSNLITDGDVFENGMFVPENLYIIGTMNDIDRSVETFDFAMRRRFTWIEIQPEERISMWDEQIDEFKALAAVKMDALNKIIKNNPELGDHFQIGPAYFLKLKEHEGNFTKLWDLNIAPLLKEYLRGTPDAQTAFDKMKATFNGTN